MLVAAGFLTIGAIAVFAGPWGSSGNHAATEPAPRQTLIVFVASHALSAGSVVGPDDIEPKSVTGSVPAGFALFKTDIIGRVTARSYAAREMISRDDLRDASTRGIAARVQPGQRAFSIRIAEDDIVGGFLQSGDHVDLFATIPGSAFPSKTAGDVPDRSRTVLLLQNVPVLAVGENPATHGSIQSSARTVSLSLAPDGLARLALAERYGKVSLAIRMPGDNSQAQPVSAVLADLIPFARPENSPPPSIPKRRHASGITFYTGARTSSLSLDGLR